MDGRDQERLPELPAREHGRPPGLVLLDLEGQPLSLEYLPLSALTNVHAQIGNDSVTGTVQAPLWSYQLGLEGGWIPPDPRKALGTCAALGVDTPPFDGAFAPWQTGGPGAGTIAASSTLQFGAFPPTSLAGVPAGQVTLVPSYTAARGPVTLPPPAFTQSVTASTGDGWFDTADTAPYVTPVAGCAYPDAWGAQDSAVPASACGATASLGGAAVAASTAAITSAATTAAATTAAATTAAVTAPATSSVTTSSSSSSSVPVVPPVATVRR